MLDAFTEVLVKQAERKKNEDELYELMMQLPVDEIAKFAFAETACIAKEADDNDWLKKYEGTALFDRAVALEEELLAIEAKRIERRMDRPVEDDLWSKEDMIRLKKRMLDLELHKGGIAASSEDEEGDEDEEGEEEEAPEVEETEDAAAKEAEARFTQNLIRGFQKHAYSIDMLPKISGEGKPPAPKKTKVSNATCGTEKAASAFGKALKKVAMTNEQLGAGVRGAGYGGLGGAALGGLAGGVGGALLGIDPLKAGLGGAAVGGLAGGALGAKSEAARATKVASAMQHAVQKVAAARL